MNEVWTLNWYRLNLKRCKIQRHKSPGTDQIPLEFIKSGCRTIRSQVHKLINSIEELPEEWKESVMVLIWKKGDKTGCNNYRSISLLSTMYRILSNILLSRLTPYAEEINRGSEWIMMQHVNYWSYILRSSNNWEKVGIRWSSVLAICRLQESLWFSLEGVLV